VLENDRYYDLRRPPRLALIRPDSDPPVLGLRMIGTIVPMRPAHITDCLRGANRYRQTNAESPPRLSPLSDYAWGWAPIPITMLNEPRHEITVVYYGGGLRVPFGFVWND